MAACVNVVKGMRRELLISLAGILFISTCELARDGVCYYLTSISLRLIHSPPGLSPAFEEQALDDVESSRENIRQNMGMHLCLIGLTIGCFFEARAISKAQS